MLSFLRIRSTTRWCQGATRTVDRSTGLRRRAEASVPNAEFSPDPTPGPEGVVVAAGTDQTLHVVDKKSGEKVKEVPLPEKLIASPTIVDGVAYVPGDSGTLFAIE